MSRMYFSPLRRSSSSNPIFTFPSLCSSFAHMNGFSFSATYYYGFFGYNRWGLRSRVR